MILLERFPHAIALTLPLALALLGRDPVAPPRATAPQEPPPVPGWTANLRSPAVRMERDTVEKHGGGASGHFVVTAHTPIPINSGEGGHGGGGGGGGGGPRAMPTRFTQVINAEPYRNRRVRVSMWVRTRLPEKPAPKMPVSQVATFMRIENEDATFVAYDGGASPLLGNTDWTRKFMVLEVPTDAFSLAFGVVVTGPGEVWIDDVLLEDQGDASGSWQKTPMVPPGRLQTMTPEQVEQGKAMIARRVAQVKSWPAEVVNADFEAK